MYSCCKGQQTGIKQAAQQVNAEREWSRAAEHAADSLTQQGTLHCKSQLSHAAQPTAPGSSGTHTFIESHWKWNNAANLQLGSNKDLKIIVQVKEFLYF